MKTLDIAKLGHVTNSNLHVNTMENCKVFDCESNPLNNRALSRYVDFLLKADLISISEAYNIKSSDEVIDILTLNLSVVYVLKRSCVFKLGELTLFANKYGVFQYFLNKDHPLNGWICLESPWCSGQILNVLESFGVKCDKREGSERVYNYKSLQPLLNQAA